MAPPHGAPEQPLQRSDATLYTVAGGLPYFGAEPASNNLAVSLSGLLKHTPKFLGRHGWPVASVMATNSSFPVSCNASVGQDIVFVGLAIDNYLIHRAQNLVLRDPQMLQVLKRIFP